MTPRSDARLMRLDHCAADLDLKHWDDVRNGGRHAVGRARRVQAEILDEDREDPLVAVYLERRADLERYFRVRLRSVEAAQDLVQDIYLKIVRRPAEPVDNPTAFLYRLGTNLMLDRLKRERRQVRRAEAWRELHGEQTGGETLADDPSADDALAARQRLEHIIAAVKELPPPVQQAFRLHKLEGLSHAETAAAMGVSRSSIEKYLMASLKRIIAKVGR